MSTSMFVKKSVTIPSALLATVDAARRERTLSAFVSEALQRQVEREGLADLVRELDAVHGSMTDDEIVRQAAALR